MAPLVVSMTKFAMQDCLEDWTHILFHPRSLQHLSGIRSAQHTHSIGVHIKFIIVLDVIFTYILVAQVL